ncbi:MAG: glutaminyl-peptide cyclotransferase [Acidimicrobiales bacterium]|nr:glutaminyl-peptide cyclotransferase [Acidimicrobiales bacterium]RZV44546.1 MAG: glutaminyl-peptide cyclotransferase [Acidimicrobiales bacterium]
MEELVEASDVAGEAQTEAPVDDFPAIEDSAVRDPESRTAPAAGTIEVVRETPHDSTAFTQGFELFDGRLFESTGLVGSSTVREVDPETGVVLRSLPVPEVFAEGLTIVDDEIVQITWTDEIAFRYSIDDFTPLGTYSYNGQGWGLCDNGAQLVMSDGSATLTFRDRATFDAESTVQVTYNGAPVEELNELECVGDSVYANIWKSALIVEIDAASGDVLTVYNANALWPEETRANAQSVLNGIAYDDVEDTFLLTGKNWPVMYEVRLHSAP